MYKTIKIGSQYLALAININLGLSVCKVYSFKKFTNDVSGKENKRRLFYATLKTQLCRYLVGLSEPVLLLCPIYATKNVSKLIINCCSFF